jgi:hypothetical protein
MNALVPIMVLYGLVAVAGFYFAGKERASSGPASEGKPAKGWPPFPATRVVREGDRPGR